MKLSVLLLTLFTMPQAFASYKFKVNPADINQKLSIDFTKADLVDFTKKELIDLKVNKKNKFILTYMEAIASDHSNKIEGKLLGVSFVLNPLIDNKEYDYFFMFNVENVKDSQGLKSCMAITDKEFTKYSASCFHSISVDRK